MPMDRRTKIVATLGPAADSREGLRTLIDAGVDAVRFNLSHGAHAEHSERAWLVREIAAELGRPVALIADLQGPKLRIGALDEPVVLRGGDEITVCAERTAARAELPVAPAVIGDVLEPGHDILIDDGRVRLRVEDVDAGRARCSVVVGGTVTSHKGVNLPGVPLRSRRSRRRTWTTSSGRSRRASTSSRSRSSARLPTSASSARCSSRRGSHAHVIAKIEKAEAVDALDEILAATDAVMVARGDLGVEIGPASVPLVQKRIIRRALELGKTVITATQMLETMIDSPEPTRAEASDVANAILDGTSAVMLSGETAVGEYPVEAVAYMDRIAHAVEPSHRLPARDPRRRRRPDDRPGDVERRVRHRRGAAGEGDPRPDVLRPHRERRRAAPSRRPDRRAHARRLGDAPARARVGSDAAPHPRDGQRRGSLAAAVDTAREAGIVASGDRVVITAGTAVNIPGSTNVIKVDIA